MGLFKLRKPGAQPAAPAPSETIEAMRRRARQRLIGAAVLVLAGVIGFPLLFDTKPRAVAVDIPIEIPDRNKPRPPATAPAPAPAPASPSGSGPAVAAAPPAVSGPVTPAPAPPPAATATPTPAAAAPAPAPRPSATAERSAPIPVPKVPAQTTPQPDEAARAQALLEGRRPTASSMAAPPAAGASSAPAVEGRYVVQVGSFADATRAREARAKLERAGIKTYTHVAETKDGKRIRVRVGPFASRADADKAAQKVKGLDLPAAVLTL